MWACRSALCVRNQFFCCRLSSLRSSAAQLCLDVCALTLCVGWRNFVPGVMDASALVRSILVSLGSGRRAASAPVLAVMLSILFISDHPSEPITKADEIMSWYCCLSCCMSGIGRVSRFSQQQSKSCFLSSSVQYCIQRSVTHIAFMPQFHVSVCSLCVRILYVKLPQRSLSKNDSQHCLS